MYRWGKIFTEYPLRFMISDDTITLKYDVPNLYGGMTMTAKYIGDGWTYEGMFNESIIETTFFDKIFDHTDWDSNENVKPGDPPGIRKTINKNIMIPRFMLFFNNYQNLHNTMFKSSGIDGTNNCAFTIDALKTGTIKFTKQRRNFCSIAVSSLDEDNDFYIINPKKLPTDSS